MMDMQTSNWWETLHLSYGHNIMGFSTSRHQWGDTKFFA